MKKYFMKGTDDELRFNDIIELDFMGEEDGVTKHSHLEIEFLPELVDELLEEEVIEVREEKDEDELIDFEDAEKVLQDHEQMIEHLTERIEALEKDIKRLMKSSKKK